MNPLRGTNVLLLVSVLSVTALSGCIDQADVEEYDWSQWEDEWDGWAQGMQESYEDWKESRERQKAQEGHASSHHHHDDEETSDHEHQAHDGDDDAESRDVEDYDDADTRHRNTIDGHEDSKRTISVPQNAGKLTVALSYDFDGHGEFVLRNPLGIRLASEDFNGEKQTEEDPWYETDDPMPGDWTLEIDLHGEGAYAVGFYH